MKEQIANTSILERFKRLVSAKRLAHAYVFVGPKGCGKLATAKALAQSVNCEKSEGIACGQCPSCLKIASGNHPDVYVYQQEDIGIKIDDVRGMLGRLNLKAFEAKVKVFILCDVDLMTTEAANALLKSLEEPAPGTLLVLTTNALQNCLPTIISRCHAVRFFTTQETMSNEADKILDIFLTRGTGEDFVKQLSADKKYTQQAMQVLLMLTRDAALLHMGVTQDKLHFRHRFKDIEAMAHQGMDGLTAITQQVVRTKSLANENLNVKMALSLLRQRIWGNSSKLN